MNGEQIAKYVKAAAALVALAGITILPEHQEILTSAFLIIYTVVTGIQGKIFKGDK